MLGHVYFPNLNGLRFIAAFMVLLSHLEWLKFSYKMPNVYEYVKHGGGLGVTLFFVLSGFLISYLLLQEKTNTGDISIKKFYIRRILRIWPVYYLTVILAFFILPYFITLPGLELQMYNKDYFVKLSAFSFLMANVSYAIYPIVPFASQLWSIGVEEQFYLMWPLIVKKRTINFHKILVYIILTIVVMRVGMDILYSKYPSNKMYYVMSFVQHFRIQEMAIGALGALILFYRKQVILNFIFSKEIEILNLIITAVVIYTGTYFGILNEEIYATLFLVMILNAAYNPNTVLKLENGMFKYLGKISYGIYVYQILAIKIAFLLVFETFHFSGDFLGNVAYYLTGAGVTILMATASYYLMEKRFLEMKTKFTLVPNN